MDHLVTVDRSQTAAGVFDRFRLDGRTAVVTGGAGLFGVQHAEVIVEAGGRAILWDIHPHRAEQVAERLCAASPDACHARRVDITDPAAVEAALQDAVGRWGRVDILINNAANDPKMGGPAGAAQSRLENLALDVWHRDIAVGLTGAFLCSQAIGRHMAATGGGVILNIASDLGLISPDQRIYRQPGVDPSRQPVKPVTYSVIKHGLVGLTKYLATYWAEEGVRANAISPGGMYTDQSLEFVAKLTQLIPLGRMARKDEYKAAVLFLISDASSYMTGANLSIDGGRTTW